MSLSLSKPTPARRESQLLAFSSCGRQYACDLLWVKEVLRAPTVMPVNLVAPYVRGVVHLRGQILTALDLESRLGHEKKEAQPVDRCIVFKTSNDIARLSMLPEDSEMADSDPTGVVVDSIGDILPTGAIVLPSPPEALSGLDTRFISGVISGNDGLIIVLRIGALISMPENKKNLAA